MSQLTNLRLSENKLGGVPAFLGNLTNLIFLMLTANGLGGSIPPELGSLNALQVLRLYENSLSGVNFPRLRWLFLGGNQFTGGIPKSVSNMSSLYSFEVSSNLMSGRIPENLGSLPALYLFNCQDNHFGTGKSGLLKNLELLVFSRNELSGAIPSVLENKLSGKIPKELGNCLGLELLFLSSNHFQGSIPSSLGALKSLKQLNLSDNNLTGGIPLELGNLAMLQYLGLSFNKLSGPVPTNGVFKNKSALIVSGNLELCGGIPQLRLPSCIGNSRRLLSVKSILIISLTCGVCFLALLVLLGVLLFGRKKQAENSKTPSSDSRHQRMSYKELYDATDGFSPTNLIGAGSFESVFKGNLQETNQQVAVKVLNLQKSGASKSFVTECNALKEIRHRNLLKIVTSCSSTDFKGNEFLALVYELMPNGSLESWLHGSMNLNIYQRLNIALDVALALDYLHHQCETPVVHCDLKPSNILLDTDMVAHIGDFGLAKLLDGYTEISKNDQTYSSAIKGTIGYVAPEYASGGRVSTIGDIYSYGILVLEMFTGKRPTDEIFKDGMNLKEFSTISKNIKDIMDPKLLTEMDVQVCDDNAVQAKIKCFAAVIALGNACSMEQTSLRINITDAIRELHAIRKILPAQENEL